MLAYMQHNLDWVLNFTSNKIQEEAKATEKEPKKESATTAATPGNILVLPTTTFEIWVAVMLLILNSLLRYTIKFPTIPVLASDIPAIIPIVNQHYKIKYKHA